MADKKRHINIDYNALLRRYAAGDISKAQRFALEKRALDDPFVADALEGIRLEREADLKRAVDSINAKTSGKGRIKKTTGFWTWRLGATIAATLLLVSIIGYQIIGSDKEASTMASTETLITNPKLLAKNTPEIAEVLEPQAAEIPLEKIASSNIESAEEIVRVSSAPEKNKIEIKEDINLEEAKPGTPSSSKILKAKKRAKTKNVPESEFKDLEVKQEEVLVMDTKMGNEVDEAKDSNDAAEGAVSDQVSDLDDNYKAPKLIKISGQVLSTDDMPLIGANVVMLDSQDGTTTDIDGKYALEVSDFPVELLISYVGFGNEYRVVIDSSAQVIVMQEHQNLNEIVVTNAGKVYTDGVGVDQASGVMIREKPVSGFFVLEEFIKDNKWQSVNDKKTMNGYVLVGFTITTEGETKNLRIVSSSCTSCHDRAKWLIENSGLWHNLSASDIQATYQISF